jgi:Na+/melibiose symporter-like transporter
MVPLTLFRSRNFTGANLTTLGVYFALQGTSFFVVLYLQNVMGYSALTAGLVLAPTSLLLLVLSPVFGKMSGERGARLFMTVGPLVCGVGLFLFTRLSPDAGFWTRVLPATVVFGLGMSVTVAPLTDTVMSAVSDRYSGIAAAVNNVTSRVAGLLAVAGLGVVVTLTFRAVVASRIADLSLSPSATEAIERVAEEPTGGFDIEQLPPEASEAVASSYTVGFRRAMIVSASMAALGGIVAAITIQDTGSGQTSRTDQGKDG